LYALSCADIDVRGHTPVFEHVCMWEIEHIRQRPVQKQQAVSCLMNDVV
jgi:hypothetical protein